MPVETADETSLSLPTATRETYDHVIVHVGTDAGALGHGEIAP